MDKGYGSCLVCESVLFVCVCLSVTALAASAYVYTAKQQYSQIINTVASLIHPCYRNGMDKYTSGCMHLHQKWAELPLPGSCLLYTQEITFIWQKVDKSIVES